MTKEEHKVKIKIMINLEILILAYLLIFHVFDVSAFISTIVVIGLCLIFENAEKIYNKLLNSQKKVTK